MEARHRSVLEQRDAQLASQKEALENIESSMQTNRESFRDHHLKQQESVTTLRKHFNRNLVGYARKERAEVQAANHEAATRLGIFKTRDLAYGGGQLQGGAEYEAIEDGLKTAMKERKAIETLRKTLQSKTSSADEEESFEIRELCTTRMSFNTREEQNLKKREQKLSFDRVLYMKQLKTHRAQETSRWREFPVLGANQQYQVLNMLGKGGFSEVWKAYDMEQHRYCAVKIHEVKKDYTEEQKDSYVRHAVREYEIQRKIEHPRIVGLYDRFPIDANCFGTVMEYCEGDDLDTYLKANGPIIEKEARGLCIQLVTGLKVLSTAEQPIIHYDLKPGNLLIDKGEIKITDFGLSKVLQSQEEQVVENTSPGAGTYWYLPPECFKVAKETAPKISAKVDVWSTGIIFFEMLFARKPFGNGMSQDAIARQGTILGAGDVDFPTQPKVSNECKEFIRFLLTHNVNDRPDVMEVYNHTYLRGSAKGAAANAANAS
jgi:tousled-like kinase